MTTREPRNLEQEKINRGRRRNVAPLSRPDPFGGRNVVLKFSRVPKDSYNFPQNLKVNLGSWSEIMDIGIPCNKTISLIYSFASLSSE